MISGTFFQRSLIYIRHFIIFFRNFILIYIYGMKIDRTVRISLKAKLDYRNAKGISIGEFSYVAFGAVILSHDMASNVHSPVAIGKRCFIGANSIILPGVTIGDECVIAAGAVVSKNIPSGSLVVGNPGRIIRSGVKTMNYGQMVGR